MHMQLVLNAPGAVDEENGTALLDKTAVIHKQRTQPWRLLKGHFYPAGARSSDANDGEQSSDAVNKSAKKHKSTHFETNTSTDASPKRKKKKA